MKQSTVYTMVAALAFGLAGIVPAAWAQSAQPYQQPAQTQQPAMPGHQQPMQGQQQPAQNPQHSQQPSQQDHVIASGFTAEVTGTVKSVDHQSGKLTLSGSEGDINVRFPAAAVQNVQQGDLVTVAVGLVEQNAPSASPRTAPQQAPMPGGSSSMPGTGTSGSPSGGTR
jgi:hypothetical protein